MCEFQLTRTLVYGPVHNTSGGHGHHWHGPALSLSEQRLSWHDVGVMGQHVFQPARARLARARRHARLVLAVPNPGIIWQNMPSPSTMQPCTSHVSHAPTSPGSMGASRNSTFSAATSQVLSRSMAVSGVVHCTASDPPHCDQSLMNSAAPSLQQVQEALNAWMVFMVLCCLLLFLCAMHHSFLFVCMPWTFVCVPWTFVCMPRTFGCVPRTFVCVPRAHLTALCSQPSPTPSKRTLPRGPLVLTPWSHTEDN